MSSNPKIRLCLWSGPRNVSTALMYSFAQRSDTRVVDEPLYAHYLSRSGVRHPGGDAVLAAQENDGQKVVDRVILGPSDRPVLFLKQMAHHLRGLDSSFLRHTVNVLLVRDPKEVLTSLVHQLPEPRLVDTGVDIQVELLDQLRGLGQEPIVLDSREVLLDPRGVLSELCRRIDIPFDPAMLTWSPGARPEDGVWAPHWYKNVHRSQGFAPYQPKNLPVPKHVQPVLAEAMPLYEKLADVAIRAKNSST